MTFCLLERCAEVWAGDVEVGVGNAKGNGDGRLEVGHKEAEPRGCVSDVAEAASEGFYVKDKPNVFNIVPFAAEQVDSSLDILDVSADG